MINRDEVVKIYDLANLELTENVDDLYEKYNTVLDFASMIMECNTEGVDYLEFLPQYHSILREDTPKESIPREVALKNAKSREYGYFKLKKVVE